MKLGGGRADGGASGGTGAVSVRTMAEADLAAVHEIEVASSPDPWSLDLLAGELDGDRNDRLWLVVEQVDDRAGGGAPSLMGFGGLLFVADECHVMNMAVSAAFRRRGVARRLLAQLLVKACDRGATAATLEVRATNEAAIGLYASLGFAEAGRRPRYYPNGDDAIIMWLHRMYQPDCYQRLVSLVKEPARG